MTGALAISAWICVGVLSAPPPDLHTTYPIGAQRGQELNISIYGANLAYDAEVITPIRGKFEIQAPASRPAAPPNPVVFKAKIAADMPVGVYPISIHTPGGISNRVFFSVGAWPVVMEAEPNETQSAAQMVTLPVTVNGSLTPADQDHYAFEGKAGQRVVLETEASRVRTGVDSTIALFSPSGREMYSNDDAPGLGSDSRIDVVLPEDGKYVALVHDTQFGSPNPNQYRLKIGEMKYAESIFPLGGPLRDARPVRFVGGNLAATVNAVLGPTAPALQWTTVAFAPGDSAALPFRFALGSGDEVVAPPDAGALMLDPGVTVNGLIAHPGEVDLYVLAVKPNQRWRFEVQAASLGTSQLDGLLSIFDDNNNRLALVDDGNGSDPVTTFKVPANVRRLFITLEDLHGRGGESFAYRLRAAQPEPNYSLRIVESRVNIPREGYAFVTVQADRVDYNGPIQLCVPESLRDVVADGGLIGEGQNEGVLVLTARGNAPSRWFDLPIVGAGGPAAQAWERASAAVNVPAASGPELSLPAAISDRLPISLTPKSRRIVVPQGHTATIDVHVKRDAGVDGEITWVAKKPAPPAFVPVGISGNIPAKAADGKIGFGGPVPDRYAAISRYELVLAGRTKVGEQTIEATLPPIVVEVVAPFSVRLLSGPAEIEPGGTYHVVGLVERVSPFIDVVRVKAVDLPPAVTAEPFEVPAGQSYFYMTLKMSETATPGAVKFNVRSSTSMEGRKQTKEYEIPDLPAEFTVKVRPPQSQPAATQTAPAAK